MISPQTDSHTRTCSPIPTASPSSEFFVSRIFFCDPSLYRSESSSISIQSVVEMTLVSEQAVLPFYGVLFLLSASPQRSSSYPIDSTRIMNDKMVAFCLVVMHVMFQ